MPPEVNYELCTGCGTCEAVCPSNPNVFEIKEEKSWVVHPESCTECGECVASCPSEAITLVTK